MRAPHLQYRWGTLPLQIHTPHGSHRCAQSSNTTPHYCGHSTSQYTALQQTCLLATTKSTNQGHPRTRHDTMSGHQPKLPVNGRMRGDSNKKKPKP